MPWAQESHQVSREDVCLYVSLCVCRGGIEQVFLLQLLPVYSTHSLTLFLSQRIPPCCLHPPPSSWSYADHRCFFDSPNHRGCRVLAAPAGRLCRLLELEQLCVLFSLWAALQLANQSSGPIRTERMWSWIQHVLVSIVATFCSVVHSEYYVCDIHYEYDRHNTFCCLCRMF